jgi:hypothetical protein
MLHKQDITFEGDSLSSDSLPAASKPHAEDHLVSSLHDSPSNALKQPRNIKPLVKPAPAVPKNTSPILTTVTDSPSATNEASNRFELTEKFNEHVRTLQKDLQKKNARISELKEKNKVLQDSLQQASNQPNSTVEMTVMKEKFNQIKKKSSKDERVLQQKQEELDTLKWNYEKLMKILQSKKAVIQSKQQSSSWRNELVKRNQEVAEKHQLIQVCMRLFDTCTAW